MRTFSPYFKFIAFVIVAVTAYRYLYPNLENQSPESSRSLATIKTEQPLKLKHSTENKKIVSQKIVQNLPSEKPNEEPLVLGYNQNSSPSVYREAKRPSRSLNKNNFSNSLTRSEISDYSNGSDGSESFSSSENANAPGTSSGGSLNQNTLANIANSSSASTSTSTTSDPNAKPATNGGGTSTAAPTPILRGSIAPLKDIEIVSNSSAVLIDNAYAASCSALISLYSIDATGKVSTTPIKSISVQSDARFDFNANLLKLNYLSPNSYMMEVDGCGHKYSRIVTGFYSDQNINIDTTLISKVLEVQTNKNVPHANLGELAKLTEIGAELNSNSLDDSYKALSENPIAESHFIKAFESPISVLTNTKPQIVNETVPVVVFENSVSSFTIDSQHWYSLYGMTVEWYLDEQFVISNLFFDYLPGKNTQGSHVIKVVVGKDNGVGRVDISKPFITKEWSIINMDTFPVITPTFALNISNPTPVLDDSILLDINTGAALINCETLSDLAVTENNIIPQAQEFQSSCAVQNSQTIIYNVLNGVDGPQTLYLWAKDSAGNISTPETLNYRRDTTLPVASVTNITEMLLANGTKTLDFSGSDDNQVSKLELFYSLDNGTNYTQIATLPAGETSYSWSIPHAGSTNAIIKLVVTDEANKTSTALTDPFVIDNTVPGVPQLTVLTPNPTNTTDINFTINNCSEYTMILINDGTAPALGDLNWQSCSSVVGNYHTSIPANEGDQSFTVWGKNIIGNISDPTLVTHTYDSQGPGAPSILLTSETVSSTTLTSYTVNDCLDRDAILVSESPIAPSASDPEWQACNTNADGISYTLIGPVLQGNHDLYVFAKDAVGNLSLSTPLSMIYDTANPVLNLSTSLAPLYRGGEQVDLDFSASDVSGLSLFKLEYAADGVNFSLVANLDIADTTYSWTVPTDNTSAAILRLVAKDQSNPVNTATVSSSTFTIDSIAPAAPAATLASSYYSKLAQVDLTITSCADRAAILVNEGSQPLSDAAQWVTCVTTPAGITYTLPTADQGVRTLKIWAKDAAGNVSATSASVNMDYDSVAPVITIADLSVPGNKVVTVNFTLTELNASSAQSFLVEYHNGVSWSNWTVASTNGPHSGSSFQTSITTPNAENTSLTLKISYVDKVGNTGTTSVALKTDIMPPSVTKLLINNGDLRATNNNVKIELSANDATSRVKYFCLKYNDSSTPLAGANCWKDITAPIPGIALAQSINFTDYYYQIGFIKSFYTVYAWAKDETGQISVNTGVLNVDKYIIEFDPETPPYISALQVTNSNTTVPPVSAGDLFIPASTDVFIKWNATDNEGFPATPIAIEYSIDDIEFLPMPGGSSLLNAANGSCTVDPGYTGCAKLTSPTGDYYRIRVIATDTLNTTVFFNSVPLNEGRMKVIAGNTEHGLDGSALSAVFYTYGTAPSYAHKHKIAVSEDGKVFYLDPTRGLLWIDTTNGILKTFIQKTGVSSGDGGNVSSATLVNATAITIDAYNNLLIWDTDTIRRVNLETMIINTVIGGGLDPDPATTVNATDLKLGSFHSVWGTLIPLPNGDIIFKAPSNSLHARRYRASDKKIELINLQGTGYTGYPADDWASREKADLAITYNPTTSAIDFMMQAFYKVFTGDSYTLHSRINHTAGNETTPYPNIAVFDLPFNATTVTTALDGKIYSVDRFRSSINIYNSATNVNTRILGTGTNTLVPCAENTPALSCGVNIDSIYVSKNGRVYFVDNGIVRTIDDNQKVISLFGQYPSYGNTQLATTARFGKITEINMGKYSVANNKIIIHDSFSGEYREFTIDGTVNKVTDNFISWHGPGGFDVDPATGDIFSAYSANLRRFIRTSSTWNNIVGGGANAYYSPASNGLVGSSINLVSGYHVQTAGFINNKIFYQKHYFDGTISTGCMLKTYDAADSYRQAHFTGNGSCTDSPIVDNTALATQYSNSGTSRISYFKDPNDLVNKYFFHNTTDNKIYNSLVGGTVHLFATMENKLTSFARKTDVTGLNFYYCGNDTGLLYHYNYTSGETKTLAWVSPTIKCKPSRNIIYNAERDSLIFPYTQNGLDGVAEYSLAP